MSKLATAFKNLLRQFYPKKIVKNVYAVINNLIFTVKYVFSFSFMLSLYFIEAAINFISKAPFLPEFLRRAFTYPIKRIFNTVSSKYRHKQATLNRLNMIDLAMRNMQFKKSRTLITVGGMAVGIAAIVFLVSIGFGVQELVIGRVASLEELRQTDVNIQSGSKVKITDKTISDIQEFTGVHSVQPLIAVVGRVNFENSVTDVAAYGVTTDYLKYSATQPVQGRLFESNDLVVSVGGDTFGGTVAGIKTIQEQQKEVVLAKELEEIQPVFFTIHEEVWLPVFSQATSASNIIGFTKRVEGIQKGVEVWGGWYVSENGAGEAGKDEQGNILGRWVSAKYSLWNAGGCGEQAETDCVEGEYLPVLKDNSQVQLEGYIMENNLTLRVGAALDGEVLGDMVLTADNNAEVLAETTTAPTGVTDVTPAQKSPIQDSLLMEIESLLQEEASEAAGIVIPEDMETAIISPHALKEAIVNRAMIKVLGISEENAVGSKLSVSFVVVGSLLDSDKKLLSETAQYEIVGVDPDERTPFFYVPFIDLRTLGINNYSQLKVIAAKEEALPKVREQVEVLGLKTYSVADTVAQINNLFNTIRILLAIIGGVALAVASLGMFNTLTVSLLERTREVGLMKAMGMKSYEVRELFLTESMVMGFMGGFLGVFLGVLSGKLLSLLLTLYSVSRGFVGIDISSTPASLVGLTMVFALLVGLVTGFYPAHRATKISALNALRYE